MSLTIELEPDVQLLLRERAARDGLVQEEVAAALVKGALEWEVRDLAESVEGIQRGIEAFEQGRFRPFSEFAEEQRRRYNLPAHE